MEHDDEAFPKEYIDRLSTKLHEKWLKANKEPKPKYKPVPDPNLLGLEIQSFRGKRFPKSSIVENSPPKKDIEQITELRLSSGDIIDVSDLKLYDCILQKRESQDSPAFIAQNISQEPELLNPSLMHKLNGSIAQRYLLELEPMLSKLNPKEFSEHKEDISAIVHNIWVEENKDWAPENLKEPYSKLSEKEKEKDRQVVEAIMETTKEIKMVERLKTIEIESIFEDLSDKDERNIKRISSWIEEIDDLDKKLYGSPLNQHARDAMDNLKKNTPKSIFDEAYNFFEKEKIKKAQIKPIKKSKNLIQDSLESSLSPMSMG